LGLRQQFGVYYVKVQKIIWKKVFIWGSIYFSDVHQFQWQRQKENWNNFPLKSYGVEKRTWHKFEWILEILIERNSVWLWLIDGWFNVLQLEKFWNGNFDGFYVFFSTLPLKVVGQQKLEFVSKSSRNKTRKVDQCH